MPPLLFRHHGFIPYIDWLGHVCHKITISFLVIDLNNHRISGVANINNLGDGNGAW